MSTHPTPTPGTAPYLTAAPDLTQRPADPELERGALVPQRPAAARLSFILHRAATDLWDVCTYDDPGQMWEEARAIASRILAACPAA